MRNCIHLWPSMVHLGMNHEASFVNHGLVAALDYVAVGID
jgi:hypothetical protein